MGITLQDDNELLILEIIGVVPKVEFLEIQEQMEDGEDYHKHVRSDVRNTKVLIGLKLGSIFYPSSGKFSIFLPDVRFSRCALIASYA